MADYTRITDRSFVITWKNFSQAMDWIADSLSQEKAEQHEIYLMQLLVEETFQRLAQQDKKEEDFSLTLSWKKSFHRLKLLLTAKGDAYNPLLILPEDLEGDLTGYAILKAHRKRLKYSRSRRRGENIVAIQFRDPEYQEVRRILAGLICGMVVGALLYFGASQAVKDWLEATVIEPIQTVFISSLMMAIAPMIFFSVIEGIISMSYSSNIGRIGWHVVLWSLLKLAFFVAAGLLAGYLMGGAPEILAALTLTLEGNLSNAPGITVGSLLIGMVPGNVVSPFSTNNIMQTLFLACFCGFILNKMDGQLDWAREGVRFMSNFTMNVVQTVSLLLPFLVCISTIKMVMQLGIIGLWAYGRMLLVIALGLPLSFCVAALLILLVARCSPLPFLQKTVPFSALPFSSSNSSACLPATLKFCVEKLGMSERITKFTVPVGMQFNMDGTAYYVSVISMMLACTFAVEMNADFIFSLFCVEFLMAMTGVGLLVMPPVLENMGIPGTAVMHFIGIEPIIDMPGTAQNVVGDITSAFLVAGKDRQVDEAVYRS